MKGLLRAQLEQRAPSLFNTIQSVRNRRYFRKTFSQHQANTREVLFPNNADIHVLSGPFKGLRYFDEIVWGSITTKWLGSYEAELHSIVKDILAKKYKTIIDVGCAEGYYATGLAKFSPTSKIYTFDTDFISRGQLRRLADLNKLTDQIQIGTFCNHSDIDALAQGKTLVVCDIEGFEVQLLDPQAAPALCRCDILVEVHESSASSVEVEELLRSRFAPTHKIQREIATERDSWIKENRKDLPENASDAVLLKAAEEIRPSGRVWFWMQANQS